MNLHTPHLGGPLMTVELKNNIIIHSRPHGVPLRFYKMLITDLHYIGNDIDKIAGGPHAVVVFTIFAHQVFHPLTFYMHDPSVCCCAAESCTTDHRCHQVWKHCRTKGTLGHFH